MLHLINFRCKSVVSNDCDAGSEGNNTDSCYLLTDAEGPFKDCAEKVPAEVSFGNIDNLYTSSVDNSSLKQSLRQQ